MPPDSLLTKSDKVLLKNYLYKSKVCIIPIVITLHHFKLLLLCSRSIHLHVYLFLSLINFLSLNRYFSISMAISLYQSLSLFFSHSISQSLYISLYLFISISIYISLPQSIEGISTHHYRGRTCRRLLRTIW